MSKDPTFRVLGGLPSRSERYEAYRREWDRREAAQDPSDHPVHVDLESVAVCDLRCGSQVVEMPANEFGSQLHTPPFVAAFAARSSWCLRSSASAATTS